VSGEGVEGVGVLAELVGRAGERLGHAAGEHVLQQREHLVPQPDAGEARVGVVRVVPHREPRTRGPGRRAADGQQRPQERRVPPPHARERTGTGAAAEAEEHGLGLVVEGVAEQDRAVGVRAGGAERGPAGAAGRGLDTARPGDVDGVHPRRDPPLGQQRDGGRRAFGRPLLEPVVDDHGLNVVHPPDGRGGDREGERVGAAGAADDQRHPAGGIG
jgi:hypothetical protein